MHLSTTLQLLPSYTSYQLAELALACRQNLSTAVDLLSVQSLTVHINGLEEMVNADLTEDEQTKVSSAAKLMFYPIYLAQQNRPADQQDFVKFAQPLAEYMYDQTKVALLEDEKSHLDIWELLHFQHTGDTTDVNARVQHAVETGILKQEDLALLQETLNQKCQAAIAELPEGKNVHQITNEIVEAELTALGVFTSCPIKTYPIWEAISHLKGCNWNLTVDAIADVITCEKYPAMYVDWAAGVSRRHDLGEVERVLLAIIGLRQKAMQVKAQKEQVKSERDSILREKLMADLEVQFIGLQTEPIKTLSHQFAWSLRDSIRSASISDLTSFDLLLTPRHEMLVKYVLEFGLPPVPVEVIMDGSSYSLTVTPGSNVVTLAQL